MNVLYNGNFEGGWQTDPATGNQIPAGWGLMWSQPGEAMLSSGAFPFDDPPVFETVEALPECVHKLNEQLPPNEQLGGPDALILDGNAVYKVFRHLCSATLAQPVEVEPGIAATFTVNVQVHHHGDGSPGACAFRVRLNNDDSGWLTFDHGLVDRQWVAVSVSSTATAEGLLYAAIDFEVRAEADVSFFVDALTLDANDAVVECLGTPPEEYHKQYFLLPDGATLKHWTAAAGAARIYGASLGASRDDAGIGNLPQRTVYLTQFSDLQHDATEVRAWFAENYPGVKVITYGIGHETDDDGDGWKPRRYIETGTALSFHCVGSWPFDREQYLAQHGVILPTAKLVQSIGDLPGIAATRKVARIIDFGGLNLEGFNYNADPVAQADARMSMIIPAFAEYNADNLWIEIINEQAPHGAENHVKLATFFMRAMELAEAEGMKLALFSHSVGEPDYPEWDAIADTGVFEMAATGGHAISLHEYGDALDGPSHVIGRYRYLYDNIIFPRELDIPLFITEYNVQRELLGTDLLAQWAHYDTIVRADPYIAGVHVYSLGMLYDEYKDRCVELLGDFCEYAISQRGIANG